MTDPGWQRVSTLDELTQLVGTPTPRVANKVRDRLHERDLEWLAASPFCLVATADAAGNCDVSPKGDPAGHLVHVLDQRTIALAERPGNRRADGYRNMIENPHVGLNFFIPGRGDTLRVNGRAQLLSSAAFFDAMAVKGHRPILALVVEIDEVFGHCAKAFLRSGLWDPSSWHPEALPPRAVLAREVDQDPRSEAELVDYYGSGYADNLY